MNARENDDVDYEDQDAEPTLKAPEEKGPDGITAPKKDDPEDR